MRVLEKKLHPMAQTLASLLPPIKNKCVNPLIFLANPDKIKTNQRKKLEYWCYYLHQSIDSVCPVCRICYYSIHLVNRILALEQTFQPVSFKQERRNSILLKMGTEELRTLLNPDMSRFHICMKILLTGILPSLLSEIENIHDINLVNLLGPF